MRNGNPPENSYPEAGSPSPLWAFIENKDRWRIVDWLPLDSSVFTSAAYLPAQRTLYLRFRCGELYCYFDFPPQQYHDFLVICPSEYDTFSSGD